MTSGIQDEGSDFGTWTVTPEDVGATSADERMDFIREEPDIEAPADEDYDVPASEFIEKTTQSPRSKQYTKKTRKVLNKGMRLAFSHPSTVPDGATLIMYGPALSRAVGDAADKNTRVRNMVDFITEGSDNPIANMVAAAIPLAFQLVRNHEPQLQPAVRGLRIPFTRRVFKLKFGIKLGRWPRNLTHEPAQLTNYVLSDPTVIGALRDAGILINLGGGQQR